MPVFKKKTSKPDKSKIEVNTKKSTLIPLEDLDEFLKQDQTSGYSTLRNWYGKMHAESSKEAKNCDKACLCGTILGNVNKNRHKNLIPYDKYRVILGRTWDDFQEQQTVDPSYHSMVGNYINASYIGVCNVNEDGEILPQESIANPKFIIAQEPLDSTTGDFWKMVYEQRSPIIINLSGAVDENECIYYWPVEVGKKCVYSTGGSRIWVQLVSETQKPVWIERNIKIWPEGYQHLCMFVRQMQYMGWAINYSPPASNLLKFIDDVANPAIPVASTAGPIIVQSRGGIGRNGFFISAWILKQNIELGVKGVDIYNMIKHLRRYRVGFVNAAEYFIELHKFALQIYEQIPKGGFKSIEYLTS